MSHDTTSQNEEFEHLGRKSTYENTYNPKLLESFDNKFIDTESWVCFQCPEFTSLCPVTRQPDYARIEINYIPHKKLVESKSLKLYLFSFRNHGSFHESCVNMILNDLVQLLDPRYIEVQGIFTPRGGISIYPFASHAQDNDRYQKLRDERFMHHQPRVLNLLAH